MTLSKSDRARILSKIESLVQNKFYAADFNGHNWREIVDQSRSVVLEAANREDFEAQITSMLNKLGSSGLGLLGPHTKITPRNAINASLTTVHAPPRRASMGLSRYPSRRSIGQGRNSSR